MSKERAKLDLGGENLDLSEFQPKPRGKMHQSTAAIEDMQRTSEAAGFPRRSASTATRPTRKRRKRSPYTEQLNIRCRGSVRALFQRISEQNDDLDAQTFERAMKALVRELGDTDLILELNAATAAENDR